MTPQPTPSASAAALQWHPLEVIPFFRRFAPSFGRNFLYTFIWSSLFGLVFYALSAAGAGRILSGRGLELQVLAANLIGYSIPALFHRGSAPRLAAAPPRRGLAGTFAYFRPRPL